MVFMTSTNGETEEFNLSLMRGVINMDENNKEMYAYHEKDVKEFVRSLKLVLDFENTHMGGIIFDKIDKLAGQELR